MKIIDLLGESRIACGADAASKKRALELLAQLIASSDDELTQNVVFDSLLARERLGSTGLGFGVAIPHGRTDQVKKAVGAFVQLAQGVDFDAVDRQPVDLMFALLVPQEATDDHLQTLAALAEMFKQPQARQMLREAKTPEALAEVLRRWSSGEVPRMASSGN